MQCVGGGVGQRVAQAEQVWEGRLVLVTTYLGDEAPTEQVYAVHVVAFDGGQVVLTRHLWRGFTVPGGHVEDGETFEEAARRECREEAGITIAELACIGWERVETAAGEAADPRHPSPGYQVFFCASVTGYGAITAVDECDEVRAFSPEVAEEHAPWIGRHRELWGAALAHQGRQG